MSNFQELERAAELERLLIAAFRVVRRARNVEFKISTSQIRAEAVAVEMEIERSLGKKEFERLCKKAFND